MNLWRFYEWVDECLLKQIYIADSGDCHSPQNTRNVQPLDHPGFSAYLTEDLYGVRVVLHYLGFSPIDG